IAPHGRSDYAQRPIPYQGIVEGISSRVLACPDVRLSKSLSWRAKKLSSSKVPLISVVDDDHSVVEATVSLLESVGYAATGFVSAQDFLNSPQLRLTACLILDVCMPGMGGFELQRRLAADGVLTPIIFITAHGDTEIPAGVLGPHVTAL